MNLGVKMQPARVLVIDDEPNNFDAIESLLSIEWPDLARRYEYQLSYSPSGKEAINFINSYAPNLILLDVMMPEMDGIVTCQKIRSLPRWRSIPIIMITALSGKEDLARCLEAGADDFISKPVNAIELKARVDAMLRLGERYDRVRALSSLQEDTIQGLSRSLQELQQNISSTLPHELNTPLNGLIAGLQLLRFDLEDRDLGKAFETIDLFELSARRLEASIRRLVTYSQLYLEGDWRADRKNISVLSYALIAEKLTARARSLGRGEDLALAIPEEVTVPLPAEYLLLLLDEIVHNAFENSPSGSRVSVTGERQLEALILSVCDRGAGISPEHLAEIAAFMAPTAPASPTGGIGLGFKIVKKTVERIDGRFEITSDRNGTHARLVLPTCQDSMTGG